ncbi:polysaccharide pyruvyl transferase family protein [Flavicella sediminum]|uniref:polysaccharide pyruvyl transferase family protein n=1 Tax=Flavicella sediminum TaxID=2585141 RepID=UPI00111EB6C7|nr:polysaccharide pyruvyl transferase family protein [Flavicella sediminum]
MIFNKILYKSLFLFLLVQLVGCKNVENKKQNLEVKKILLRSSWQTVNIGDIAHTPGVLALCEQYMPDVEIRLWASDVDNGVKQMLEKRFPNLEIFLSSDTVALQKAFKECDFLLHGSGPYLVEDKDVEQWIQETGKPFGVYGITLSKVPTNIEKILNQAEFVFFRDTVSLQLAKRKGVKSPIMEFGPDGAFACDLRNDSAALKFMAENNLEEGKFLCVIPKYRRTPYWKIPGRDAPFNAIIDRRNQEMKEHDLKPYRDAIIAVARETSMKILICPEDMTQVALGKEMLYDPLPEDVKEKVVWRNRFWLTDEALSVYTRSAGLFGLEQHSPIMCIGNGIPALVGRFKEQSSKGYMWHNIGLKEWFFDSDNKELMDGLTPTVLSLIQEKELAHKKTQKAKEFVEKRQAETMEILKNVINK